MKKNIEIFGLQPKKVALLFTIGSSTTFADEKNRSEHQKAELLKFRLTKVIVPSREKTLSLSDVSAQIFDILGSLVGDEIGELILLKDVDLDVLNNIKKYGKRLVREAKSNTDIEVGLVIYYAAISNALVFKRAKISKKSYDNLYNSINTLRKKSWIPGDIQKLFKITCLRCSEHMDRGNN